MRYVRARRKADTRGTHAFIETFRGLYTYSNNIFAIIYRIENVRIIFLLCSFYSDCCRGEGHRQTSEETFHDLIYCVYCWLCPIHIFMYELYRNRVMFNCNVV